MDSKGQCAGGVLYNIETEEYFTVKAKATIIATGGYGRLHIRGFDTTNHYGATGDGLIMAYKAGAKLMYMDSVQYHPTGSVFPEQIAGFLITEKIRGAGGQPPLHLRVRAEPIQCHGGEPAQGGRRRDQAGPVRQAGHGGTPAGDQSYERNCPGSGPSRGKRYYQPGLL